MINNILLTSGYNFEGYRIVRYLGYVSGESALGTGFLSSLGAGFADFLGTNSTMYSGKLRSAKDIAINELIELAEKKGANAIIGLDVDYTTFAGDIMGVSANGTAVLIQPIDSIDYDENSHIENGGKFIPINIVNQVHSLNLEGILVRSDCNKIALKLYSMLTAQLLAVRVRIKIDTIFEENYMTEELDFFDFANCGGKFLCSDFSENPIPQNIIKGLKTLTVIVIKYVTSEGVQDIKNLDTKAVADLKKEMKDSINPDYFMRAISGMKKAADILNYTKELEEESPGCVMPELLEIIESCVSTERMFGNTYGSCVNKIEQFFKGE